MIIWPTRETREWDNALLDLINLGLVEAIQEKKEGMKFRVIEKAHILS